MLKQLRNGDWVFIESVIWSSFYLLYNYFVRNIDDWGTFILWEHDFMPSKEM